VSTENAYAKAAREREERFKAMRDAHTPGPKAFPVEEDVVVDADDVQLEAGGAVVIDYKAQTVKELRKLASDRNVEVKGSGKGGRKLKADYVKALSSAESAGQGGGGTTTSDKLGSGRRRG
jgi:hypothetical protein